MNEFTKGVWLSYTSDNLINTGYTTVGTKEGKHIYTVDCDKSTVQEVSANAKLIAAAGTIATQLSEQNYNAQNLIEHLPEILVLLERAGHLLEDGITSKHIEKLFCRLRSN